MKCLTKSKWCWWWKQAFQTTAYRDWITGGNHAQADFQMNNLSCSFQGIRIFLPWITAPEQLPSMKFSQDNYLPDNYPWLIPPWTTAPRTVAPMKFPQRQLSPGILPPNNYLWMIPSWQLATVPRTIVTMKFPCISTIESLRNE